MRLAFQLLVFCGFILCTAADISLFAMSENNGSEDTPAVNSSAAISICSNYIWRGQKLSDGIVSQPTVGIIYKGLNVLFWSNYDHEINETTETDFTLSYRFPVNSVEVEFAYANYAFDGYRDSQEFYFRAGLDMLFNPAMTFYYDVDEGEGGFLLISAGHSLMLTEAVPVDLSFSAGINFKNALMGVNSNGKTFSGLYNCDISVASVIPLFDAVSTKPFLAYTFPLSKDAKAALRSISFDGTSAIFYGGLTISLEF